MNLFFSVADYSSELYAEKLINNLINIVDGKFFVIGGKILKNLESKFSEKIEFWLDSVKYSSIGLFENLDLIPAMYLDYLKLQRLIFRNTIDWAILFDAPAVNIKLIKIFKKLGTKMVYIIPPKSWSLQRTNVHKFVEDNCDVVIVPFKFNLKTYVGRNVFYLGHPIVDVIDRDILCGFNVDNLAIFPGSRRFEVNFVSKLVFDTLPKLIPKFKEIWVSSTFLTENSITKFLDKVDKKKNLKVSGNYCEIIKKTGIALAASGTVVLKNSLFLLPTISFYRVYKISEFIFRKIKKINIQKFALPNILWNYEFGMEQEEIVPELIQEDYNSSNLMKALQKVLDNYDLFVDKLRLFRKMFFELSSYGVIDRISSLLKEVFYGN